MSNLSKAVESTSLDVDSGTDCIFTNIDCGAEEIEFGFDYSDGSGGGIIYEAGVGNTSSLQKFGWFQRNL